MNVEKDKSRLDLALWLLNRYDSVSRVTARRASVVLSADAILAAATALLLDKSFPVSAKVLFTFTERALLVTSIGITFVLLGISIYFSLTALANVWKPSRDILGADLPRQAFFHPRDFLKEVTKYEDFEKLFIGSTEEEVTNFAMAELWTSLNIQHKLSERLITSIKLTVASLPFFFISTVLLLLKIYG